MKATVITLFACTYLTLSVKAQIKPTSTTTAPATLTPELLSSGYTGPLNYVRTFVAQKPTTDPNALSTVSSLQDVQLQTAYLDGLGRPLQSVSKGGSPLGKDLVAPVVYDAFGREALKYSPYVATTGDGLFKLDPFPAQASFYTTQLSGQGEQFFYSKTEFEASPLNRVTKSMAPGNAWAGSGRGVEMSYEINTASEVRIWSIGFATGAVPTSPGYYSAGELYRTITKDEHGKRVVEYKDKEGRVVLKKVEIDKNPVPSVTSHTGWLSTYYVYDDLGQLRYVVPPKAVSEVIATGTIPQGIDKELCFRYEYDERGRMIRKKVPGAAEVWMVYDARDRLVFTQDGNMRGKSWWMVTYYDELNRPVATGIMTYVGGANPHGELIAHAANPSHLVATTVTAQGSQPQATLLVPLRENGKGSYTASQAIEFTDGFESEPGAAFETFVPGTAGSTSSQSTYSVSLPGGASVKLLTQTFYDDYSFTQKAYNTAHNAKLDAGTSLYPETLPSSASTLTKGLTTGSKAWVMEDAADLSKGRWLETVLFYDDKARAVQVQSDNVRGGVETAISRYDFTGKVIATYQVHQNPGSTASETRIKTSMAYDHGGRLLSVKKQLNDQGTAKTVLQNEYDELGQLKTKKLGNKPNTSDPLETLAYEYNIRGWLRGINKDYVNNITNGSFFGQTLSYDVGFTAQQYNGNIAGLQWRSKGDGEQRAYGFDYDAANRLLKADFTQNNGAWDNAAGVDFSVKMGDGADHTTAYDANGNIKAMSQMGLKLGAGGMTSTLVDQLSYHYFDHSNKLKNVLDAVNDITTKLGDFRSSTGYMNALGGTKTAAAIDYGYDVNGNLLTDRNKNMGTAAGLDVSNGGAITYNHLNLPYQIKVKKDDGSDKGTVTYIYDAAGAKLQKITHELASGSTPAKTTTTSYIGGFVYEHAAGGEELQLFPHEEGRVRPLRDASGAITSYAFDYMLKDHLGNVRMVLTEEMKQDVYPAATLEPGKLATEKDYYSISDLQIEEKTNVNGLPDYPNNNVIPNPPVNGTFDNANSTKVYRLNKNSAKMGLGMTLKVMAGDKLNIWGKSYYTDQNTAGNSANEAIPVLDLLNAMLGTPGGSAAASAHGAVTGAQLSGLSSAGINALFSNQTANNNQYATKPKAFINYLFFDEQFKCVGGNFSAVHDNGYTLKDHHGELSDIAVPKNGYVYIYCSNESPVNVFFDNVQVVHTKGAILEETHYYPFGLTMAGISSKAAGGVENKKGYNGNELQNKEFSDGSGLEEYDFNARTYDPQLGRFIQIDPMTDEGGQESWSPYHFGYNNPVRYADPDGEFPIPLLIPFAIKAVEAAIVAYAAYKTSEAVAPHVQKVIENTAEGVRNVQSNGNSFIPLSAQAAKARYEKSLEANNTSAGNQSSASASPSNKGGKDPNDKGKRHEENGGADKGSNKERYRGESGKNRIADKSDEKAITEFKANDNYIQHFSTQIKDGIAHAVKTGREFILKLTRPEAVTKPLKKAAEDGKLKIQ